MFRKAFTDILRSSLILLLGVALLLFAAENTYNLVKENHEYLAVVILELAVSVALFKRFEALATFLAAIACFVIAVNVSNGDFDKLLSTGYYALRIAGYLIIFYFTLRVCCLLTYMTAPKLWDKVHDKSDGMFSILPDIKFIAGLCVEPVTKE